VIFFFINTVHKENDLLMISLLIWVPLHGGLGSLTPWGSAQDPREGTLLPTLQWG
jgi:hypothetical protein